MKNKYFTLNELAIEYIKVCNENKNKYILQFDAFCYIVVNQLKKEYSDIEYFVKDLDNVCDMYLQTIILMFMQDRGMLTIDFSHFKI